MKCMTRDFGEVTFKEEDIIVFTQPPFGFDEYTKYILLFDEQTPNTFAWMQSVENENLCFILMETSGIEYNPKPPKNILDKLGKGILTYFAICVITEDVQNSTANLKSPVIINETSRKGLQLILPDDYPIRYKIMDSGV